MRERRSVVSVRGQKRVLFVFAVLVIMLIILSLRTAWVQIVRGEEYTDMAVDQQTSDIAVDAKRGMILDRNGEVLASSTICYNLWIRPAQIREEYDEAERSELITKIAEITGEKDTDVREYFASDSVLLRIARHISKEQADQIRKLEIYGAELAEDTKRLYPLGTTAANLLGSVNDDGIGRSGVELTYNEYLSGVSGRRVFDKDINGNLLAFGDRISYDARNGFNIELTIDEVLQHYLDETVQQGYKDTEAEKVAGIVMDPKTGEVLAMSIYPTFDPNNPAEPVEPSEKDIFNEMSDEDQIKYLNKMWRNPLVSDVYEPGSTMKLITASATLEEGLANPNTEYYCGGSIVVEDYELYDAEHYVHGVQTLTQAVGNSCNPIHAEMALNLGYDNYYKYLDLYGFTGTTDIDYPGESLPIIQNKEDIGPVELATMGFGHGIAITPIQLVTAISAIGNDGTLMRPHLVRRITDSDGKTIIENEPEEVRKVISKNTAREVRSIMESQVEFYGGTALKIPGYRMGGKTGTAERASEGGYNESVQDTSFVSMVPVDDPQAVALIVCYGPKNGMYATETALPIARRFWIKALPYMGIEPTEAAETTGGEADFAYVPDVTNISYKEAVTLLESYGLKAEIRPAVSEDENMDDFDFTVVDQYPKAGKRIDKSEPVFLYRE
ncbi:MAG: PASTA domain-containing protein [Firmicutes bacterium]|nr:PASTA domain-containing protein [Bacillota bacterium]